MATYFDKAADYTVTGAWTFEGDPAVLVKRKLGGSGNTLEIQTTADTAAGDNLFRVSEIGLIDLFAVKYGASAGECVVDLKGTMTVGIGGSTGILKLSPASGGVYSIYCYDSASSFNIQFPNGSGTVALVRNLPGGTWASFDGADLTAQRTVKLPNLSGKLVGTGDGTDPPAAGTMAAVNRTGLTADVVTPVNLTNTTPAGFYLVQTYLEVTTARAASGASLHVLANWTDDRGANANVPIATVPDVSAKDLGQDSRVVYLASGDITWRTLGPGTYGALVYAVRLRCTYLGV